MAKVGTLTHPKTKRLARKMKMPPFAALGLLEALWQWVGRYAPTGFLTIEDLEMLEEEFRFRGNLAAILVETGWLDEEKKGFYIHDWHQHAGDLAKKNLKASGKNFHRENTFEPAIRESVATDSRIDRESVGPSYIPNQTIPNHTKPNTLTHIRSLESRCPGFEDGWLRYLEWRQKARVKGKKLSCSEAVLAKILAQLERVEDPVAALVKAEERQWMSIEASWFEPKAAPDPKHENAPSESERSARTAEALAEAKRDAPPPRPWVPNKLREVAS